jgi:hypothetical protein
MTRRIIRLYVSEGHYTSAVYARCDDDTIWKLSHYSDAPHYRWQKIPPIPQDEEPTDIDRHKDRE